ncbi:AGE family epimerase/isomerase [Paenibacillus sp. Z6-24]
MSSTYPDFRSSDFLKQHIMDTINFYVPQCRDDEVGGYHHCFFDDGTLCDDPTRHLVGQSRFVYVFSTAAMLSDNPIYRELAEHGLRFLQEYQRDQQHGGYYWILENHQVRDSSKQLYGHAFALLAAATAHKAGIPMAADMLEDIYTVLEQHFWREEDGIYVDQISADWQEVSSYRGQNGNMHTCEAMMAAYEATGESRYLDRAYFIARKVMFDLLPQSGDLIWEHYDQNWQIDWKFNYNDTSDEIRPYGHILGHSIEWSKLLLRLEQHRPESWMYPCAVNLFTHAADKAADPEHGGLYYIMDTDGEMIAPDKLYWVMTEALGAAAILSARTPDDPSVYLEFYDRLFAYCWDHLIDREHGGWYQQLSVDNHKQSNIKSPPPKADYHPVTNCITAIQSFAGSQS